MDKYIIDFLCKAKKETYAGNSGKVASSRTNSHDLEYIEGNLTYLDTYLGNEKFVGEEALWKDNVPFWSMNYMGRVKEEGFSGDFLKEALLLVPEEYPFRGPQLYENGEFKYCCHINGDMEWFNGQEEIFRNEVKVYECIFHGGYVSYVL